MMKSLKKISLVFIGVTGLWLNAFNQKVIKRAFNDSSQNKNPPLKSDPLLLSFTFKDTSDKPVRISDFKGKFVLVDLWYSGCGFCIYANRALRLVHEKLHNENIVFLSISVDASREKWIESITQNALPSKTDPWAGKYYPAKGTILLYTGGSGNHNAFIKKYDSANGYPKLLFIDPSGKLITDHPPRPDYSGEDHPDSLIRFLSSYLTKNKN